MIERDRRDRRERNDEMLTPQYDAFEMLRTFEAKLDREERLVRAQRTSPDPGDDATVTPPVADDDDDGYDPLPLSPSVRN
jgi:hypothetical protein